MSWMDGKWSESNLYGFSEKLNISLQVITMVSEEHDVVGFRSRRCLRVGQQGNTVYTCRCHV